ncbi:hypothetical protein AK88_01445 [Plasmodium fragile]|uniref:Uncharacterized protein n=1 Tax=Plasmodium fragile TaxID=5857 RepID=A0A0D9QTG7_PLAFR|nr:uncharacterized protein AK88_01445 [Plasmodium fragile]KJP88951.1 hypothetical protein AK88_01445 [Plasmodium fragile]
MDDFSDLNRSADENEEYSTESDLNEKENDVEKEPMSEVEREAISDVEKDEISDVEKEEISDVDNALKDEQKEATSDAERELLHDVEEDGLQDTAEKDLHNAEEDSLHNGDEDSLQDAEEGALDNAQGDDLDDVKSTNEGDVEQAASHTGVMNDPVVSGVVHQSGDHDHSDYEGDSHPHEDDQPGEDPDEPNHLFQDPQESGSSEDTHKKEDDYSHTVNAPAQNKEEFNESNNETNNHPSNGEGKNDQINNNPLDSMDPIEFDKKRYDHFLIHPWNQKNMSLCEGINKKLTFPSLSSTDLPIPGMEKESTTMYHFNPEKLGYKYNNGLNPSEGYLLIYPHVSHNSVPPKIKKKKLRCC